MNETPTGGEASRPMASRKRNRSFMYRRRRPLITAGLLLAALTSAVLCSFSLARTASSIKSDLESITPLVGTLKKEISADHAVAVADIVQQIRLHSSRARESSAEPLWTLASAVPGLGANVGAVTELSRSADDVANLGLSPLVEVYSSLDWETLLPNHVGSNLEPLEAAAPKVTASADAVQMSADRLNQIDTGNLLPQIAEPLTLARNQLQEVTAALRAAANASNIAPTMLGAHAPRNYLLMIQNNAEVRATGGIPGGLAVLTLDNGKLSLGAQSSAGDVGVMSPSLPVDPQQQQVYSSRLGKYMQDVNLTPDFPTAAATARLMWEKRTGQQVDGVVSIDPVVLSYILQATGPVSVTGPEMTATKAFGLPTELTGDNVVATLLSDVYARIQQPTLQDAYFAGVAKEIFSALSSGKGEASGLINGIVRGTEERRVLVWSANIAEQSVISEYGVSGSTSGPGVAPAQYGVYFNDGTGAKMDYYVKRSVQLVKECPADGYEQTLVRVTSKNTAPSDAATSLPEYVTGGGVFGVAPGSVQTNIVAYGPAQANVESATEDGKKTPLAPYLHGTRPVGVVSQQLSPGESKTVEFTFGKIVQHVEPNVVVTPTIQPVKEVIQPTEDASCG